MPKAERCYLPIEFTQVSFLDQFWAPRIETNRKVSIPHVYQKCKESGRIDAFRWKEGMEHTPHVFFDSDVAKWIEGASYSLALHPDKELEKLIDDYVDSLEKAQLPDGYLNAYFILVKPEDRWKDIRDWHELYCAGHLIEAAVAYYRATGKRRFLDVMCRYADHIADTFGPDKKRGYPGHEELELALVKLAEATGEERYLELSRFFVDERGQEPYYFDVEGEARGEKSRPRELEYFQAHKPVREQDTAVGHAVRAVYLYSAMADLAAKTGDDSLRVACDRLWDNLCLKRMYFTGGIGTTQANEGFTDDYDLPNASAYAETCAAIGLVFWAYRMLQFECDARYADILERALYNGSISGVSLSGERFFYVNPLASDGTHHRDDWFGCSCCPTNMVRFIPSVGQYFYSGNEEEIAVHLYAESTASLKIKGQEVVIEQETEYPWDGEVLLRIRVEDPSEFGIRLRIPGWCPEAKVKVAGRSHRVTGNLEHGYLPIRRKWKDGDTIRIHLSMPVTRYHAHPELKQDIGLVALQKGPIVYCLEATDNRTPLDKVFLPEKARFSVREGQGLLKGIPVLVTDALELDESQWERVLYKPGPQQLKTCTITAVPYCLWDNREPGPMSVWLREI